MNNSGFRKIHLSPLKTSFNVLVFKRREKSLNPRTAIHTLLTRQNLHVSRVNQHSIKLRTFCYLNFPECMMCDLASECLNNTSSVMTGPH
jgi:hypothetical protein